MKSENNRETLNFEITPWMKNSFSYNFVVNHSNDPHIDAN